MADALPSSPHRIESREKVTGRARYVGDYPVPNVAHAAIVRSPVAAGRVRLVDERATLRAPGVIAIFTHANFPRLADAPVALQAGGERNRMAGSAGQQFLPMQSDEVLYPGQPIALVVAETLRQARHAASLVTARIEPASPRVRLEDVRDELFAPADVWGFETDHRRGDAARALADADVRVEATYLTQTQHHVTMEPHATVAWWGENDTRLDLYESSTWVYGVRRTVATWFGLRPDRVRVRQEHVGGSFGSKGPTWPHVALCCGAARAVGRPVRLELTRGETFASVGHRPRIEHAFALGATRGGKLVALAYDAVAETSRFDDRAVAPTTKSPVRLYACPNVRTSYRLARVHRPGPFTFRAPGEAPGLFPLECAIDELAYATDLDPLEVRRRNFAPADPDKRQAWSSNGLLACYEHAAARFGWADRDPRPRRTRDGDEWVGVGMASALYDARAAPTKAALAIDARGDVTLRTATCDNGTGSRTMAAQVVAETLGTTIDRVRVELGDTDLPPAPLQAGSMTTASVGTAATRAAQQLRDQLVLLAITEPGSPLRGFAHTTLAIDDGVIRSTTDAARQISFVDLLALAGQRELHATGEAEQVNEFEDVTRYSFGAHFAEVRVHAHTGRARVTRWTAAFAAGRIVNERLAREQLVTGILWGIGQALLEETHADPRTGRWMNEDLSEYLIVTNPDVPRAIDAFFVDERDERVNPIGVKGVGEIGAIGSAPAIANAIYHACGTRVRTLPITLEKLLGANASNRPTV